jgi:hypothetical protein
LPSLSDQAERLIELDVHRIAELPADQLRNVAGSAGSLLVVHPDLAPASALAPLLQVNGKPGFVVRTCPTLTSSRRSRPSSCRMRRCT